jgi:hypothetical protein
MTFFIISPADSVIWFLVPSKFLLEFVKVSLLSDEGDETVGT